MDHKENCTPHHILICTQESPPPGGKRVQPPTTSDPQLDLSCQQASESLPHPSLATHCHEEISNFSLSFKAVTHLSDLASIRLDTSVRGRQERRQRYGPPAFPCATQPIVFWGGNVFGRCGDTEAATTSMNFILTGIMDPRILHFSLIKSNHWVQ